jgi:alginate O-acetyltransferase complex protein AlgJ
MSTTETPETPAGPAAPPRRADELEVATDAHVDLERAVLPTIVSGRVAAFLIVAFCLPILIVPIVQIALEATGRHNPQLGSLFKKEWPTRERLHKYEQDVAANSVFKQFVQPRVQLALSETTGTGNGKVYIGRDGVLFLRPGLDFVTGRGILDAGRIRASRKKLVDKGEHAAEPDPRTAILDFAAACRAAGAYLVVVPVPDKVTMMPAAAGLAAGLAQEPIVNVDFERVLDELRSAGIDVYDPLSLGVSTSGGAERYLLQDTHWTPQWMETVAAAIAEHVRAALALPAGGPVKFRGEDVTVRRVGDLVDMLGLPENQTVFAPQEVQIRKTIDIATGQPFSSRESADVLLLGDSFANIYTASQMGWGEAAGLAPTLARHLNRDVDSIVINGNGATGTRRELARRPGGPVGKRVVIWEFAARDLTEASWEPVPMPAPTAAPSKPAETARGKAIVLDVTIEKISNVPQPYSVPYPDCLTYFLMHVDRVVEGKYTDDRVLAVMWAMKKNVWLPPAKYTPGRKMRIKIIPLGQADESVKTGQRADDTQDYDHRPYFVTEELNP